MSSKWTAAADDDIKVIASGDVDGDNVSEIVAATQKKVYVYNSNGRQIKSYPIDFPPSTLYVSDIDGDGMARDSSEADT